ncbi:MAG: hypothetical protein H5T69_05935 [Chloroflexi bacterium]|nr:hypothetical protein [Chloroflexota bacterium]
MFISMTWSEGITERESRVAIDTVKQVLYWLYLRHPEALIDPPIQIRPFGNWIIPALVPDKPYWGTQWYIDSSYDDQLQQVIAPLFLELVRREPWQQADAHFDLALLEQDLTDFPVPLARMYPERYTLGSSLPGTGAVMSVYRLRQIQDTYIRELSLARLVRHHLGHVLGVPELTRRQATARLGLELHCTNPCVMRNAATASELTELALEEVEMGWPFCELCTQELHHVIVRYSYEWS